MKKTISTEYLEKAKLLTQGRNPRFVLELGVPTPGFVRVDDFMNALLRLLGERGGPDHADRQFKLVQPTAGFGDQC